MEIEYMAEALCDLQSLNWLTSGLLQKKVFNTDR